MKNFLVLILISALFCFRASAQTSVAPSGSGTSGDPYLIASLDNLYWISQNSSSWSFGHYFKQTANIDASPTSAWFSGQGWPSIGSSGTPFSAYYEGQNFYIDGLYINGGSGKGLFGYIDGTGVQTDAGVVKNLGLKNVNITGSTMIGGLCGKGTSVKDITNCYVTGSVTGSQYVGGLIGYGAMSGYVTRLTAALT